MSNIIVFGGIIVKGILHGITICTIFVLGIYYVISGVTQVSGPQLVLCKSLWGF